MVQELNYHITTVPVASSLAEKCFEWGKRCISQGKAFNIQHSIGDNESETAMYQIKFPLLKMGPLNQGRVYLIPQVVIEHCLQGPTLFYVPSDHYCVTWNYRSQVLWHKENIFISLLPVQIRAVFVMLFLSPLPKAEYWLIHQAGTQRSHQYSKTKKVEFVAWCM